MLPIKDNTARGKRAYIFSLISIAATVLTALTTLWQLHLIADYNEGKADVSDLETSDVILSLAEVVHLGIYVSYIVLFIQWFRRAYYNLHLLEPKYPRYQEGWAVGAWFIPFLNLARPFHIMQDIWHGTAMVLKKRIDVEKSYNVVGWWWACFVISNIATNISFRLSMNAEELTDFATSHMYSLIGDSFAIIGLMLVAGVIKQISSMEQRIHELELIPEDSIFHMPVQNSREEVVQNEENS